MARASAPASPRDRSPWLRLALLCLAVTLTVSAETLPAGVLPAMAGDFDVAQTAVGSLVSVWGLTVILTSIPLVRVVARVDRRLIVGLALAGVALGNLATALAPSYAVALASRVVAATFHGVFWAIVVVYATSLVRPSQLAAGLAIVTGGSQLAAAIAIPAAAAAVEVVSWRWVGAAVSIGGLAIAAAVLLTLPADVPVRARPASAPAAGEAPTRRMLPAMLLSVTALLFVFSHFIVYTYITTFLSQLAGVENARQGLFLGIVGLASLVGLGLSGPLTNRWPRGGPVAMFVLFAGAMLVVGVAGQRLAVLVVGLAVWGVMFGVIGPMVQAIAMHTSPAARRAFVSAAMVVAFNLGISSGSWVGGRVLAATSSPAASPFIAAGVLAVAAVLALVASRGVPASLTASAVSRAEEPVP